MKGKGGGSRVRETSHYERESVGFGVRQKIVPSVETPTKRRGRNNGENVAPDGATNVDMSGVKPSWTSKGSKTPVKDVAMASPALLPRFPKPSPVRNVLPTNEGQDAITPVIAGAAQEQVNGSKRKLNWDLPSGAADGVANHPSVDPSESGVKVRISSNDLSGTLICELSVELWILQKRNNLCCSESYGPTSSTSLSRLPVLLHGSLSQYVVDRLLVGDRKNAPPQQKGGC